MIRIFANANYDFLALRRKAFIVTGVLLAIGLVALLSRGLNESIEFTGGTAVRVDTHGNALETAALRDALAAQGLEGSEITPYSETEYVIRARTAVAGADADNTENTTAVVSAAVNQLLGEGNWHVAKRESVGPKVGGELRTQALFAILLSFVAVLAYLAYRFEWRFGVACVVATAHDILLTICFIALMNLEVGLVAVAAILSMVGYSLNDTIVIFDRVREDLIKHPKESLRWIINKAVNETLPRTILTNITGLATLLPIAIFGGEVIRPFALIMFFGVFTGTFSSIYIAGPVLLMIEERWPGVRGDKPKAATPRAARGAPQRA
jgi:preprotein translocase subunit SecF